MIKMLGFRFVSKHYDGWIDGMKTHGDVYEYIYDYKQGKHYPADCYLQANLIKPKFLLDDVKDIYGDKYQYILDSKKPYLVTESPPFREYPEYRRYGWHSYGWVDANCNNENVGPERWNKFVKRTNITIKDWHSPGDDIIIMSQKEGDSALTHMYETYESFYDWVVEIIKEIRKYSDRRIIIRPHPRNLDRGIKKATAILQDPNLKNVYISNNVTAGGKQGGEGLNIDLANAYCVVTFNSLSAVEAVTRGIPVFALDDMSMVWPIAHKDISSIENLDYTIDLQDWKNKIAYTMWNRDETSSGETWAHLKPVYF